MKSVKAIVEGREVITIDSRSSVLDAARVMARHQIGAVPVVDGDRLAGIFTERDVLVRVVAAGLDPAATPVTTVMSTKLIVADACEAYDVCLRRMQQAGVRHLVVLDAGRLDGIISLRDLIAVDLSEKAEAITLLNAYVHDIPAHLH
jgi:CBS domain-containing protein